MNALKPILIISLVAILGIGGFVLYNNQQSSSPSTAEDVMEQVMEDGDDLNFTGNVTQLLALGKNLTCDFSYDNVGNITTGKVYVADRGERVRGDFELFQPDGNQMTSHLIKDGETSYVWSSAFPEGYMMRVEDDDPSEWFNLSAPSSDGASQEDTLNPEDEFDYDCKRWSVNNAMFSPPREVNFIDFSQGLEDLENTLMDACGACDALSGESKTACLQAVGCQ